MRALVLLFVVMAAIAVLLTVVTNGVDTSDGSVDSLKSTQIDINLPEPGNYVVDQAELLSESDVTFLNNYIKAGVELGHPEIGVAIINSTGGLAIEEYSIRLAEKWQVGDAGLDDGAIIVLAVDDRDVRLEIGKGLEGKINDAEAGRIIDSAMLPYFREGAWFDGIKHGIDAIVIASGYVDTN